MIRRQLTIIIGILLLSALWQQILVDDSDPVAGDRDTDLAVQKLIDEMDGKYNISVTFGGLQDGDGLYRKDISGTQPGMKHVYAALVELNRALGEYPSEWLSLVLNRIHLVGKLSISGFKGGGTYLFKNEISTGKTTILLATDHDITAEFKTFIRRAFHHELSSILIIKYPFPKEQWLSFWPDDIVCPTDHLSILKYSQNYASEQEIQALYNKGFVSDYGLAGVENDINTYAELIMDDPEKMAALANQFPLIRDKLHILLVFYSGLHPDINQKIKEGPLAKFLYQM